MPGKGLMENKGFLKIFKSINFKNIIWSRQINERRTYPQICSTMDLSRENKKKIKANIN